MFFCRRVQIRRKLRCDWPENILVFAATPFLLYFFALSKEAKSLFLRLVLIHNIFNGLLFPAAGALPNGLRAVGDVRFNMYVSVLSTALCRLVLSVVLGIWLDMGVIGIAFAMCADWAVRAAFFYARYKKLSRLSETELLGEGKLFRNN